MPVHECVFQYELVFMCDCVCVSDALFVFLPKTRDTLRLDVTFRRQGHTKFTYLEYAENMDYRMKASHSLYEWKESRYRVFLSGNTAY